jgi:exoribonuclease R
MDTEMIEILDTKHATTVSRVYLPDRCVTMLSRPDKILCGLSNGKAALLTFNQ